MVGSSLSPGQLSGNLVALIMPCSFAVLIVIVRKYPNVDMIPLQLFAGIVAMLIGYFISSKINISMYDLILAFVAGFFQVGLGFIFITIGAKKNFVSNGRNFNDDRSSFWSSLGMDFFRRKSSINSINRRINYFICSFYSILLTIEKRKKNLKYF